MIPSWFPSTPAPVYGIILAATTGTRLYPLTSNAGDAADSSTADSFLPKHLLPVAGIPCLVRLLDRLCTLSVQNVVIAISADDATTLQALLQQPNQEFIIQKGGGEPAGTSSDNKNNNESDGATTNNKTWTLLRNKGLSGSNTQKQTITIMALSTDTECYGSIDAWKQIETSKIIPDSSHVVILPGDLILSAAETGKEGDVSGGSSSTIFGIDAMFRRPSSTSSSNSLSPACTMLLVDVGEKDENGIPLKESSKVRR